MKNLTNTTTISLLAAIALLTTATSAYAIQPDAAAIRNEIRQQIRNSASPTGEAIRSEIRNEIRKEAQEKKQNIVDNIKDKIKKMMPRRIHGTLSSKGTSTLVVTTNDGDVTVYVTEATQLRRRFGGASSLSEFQPGDELAIIGKPHTAASESSSVSADNSIDARYIRNISIQRRNTVFVGTITGMTSGGFTVQTQSRGEQTVHVDGDTVYQLRNTKIGLTDLKEDDRVLVKGEIWDRALNEIDAKKIIKLPAVPASEGSSSTGTSSSASSTSSAASSSSSSSAQSSSET